MKFSLSSFVLDARTDSLKNLAVRTLVIDDGRSHRLENKKRQKT